MAVTTAQFLMADRLTEGRLADILRETRAEGKSYEAIARLLHADHGVVVTAQTLTNWCDLLGIEKPLAKVRTPQSEAS